MIDADLPFVCPWCLGDGCKSCGFTGDVICEECGEAAAVTESDVGDLMLCGRCAAADRCAVCGKPLAGKHCRMLCAD